MTDRSLDEFSAPAARAEGDDGDDAESSVSDPTPTMRWSPDGAACAACGATASRLWHAEDGDAFVCADCKEW